MIEQDQARDLDAGDIKALTTALRRFRDLNLQIRTDGIVPGSFRREPEFSHLLTPRETESALAQQIEAISERHVQHTDQFQQLINRLLRQIETAKDKTETIMRAIEASFVDESALPKLADLRAILEPQLDTNKTGDK